MGLDKRDDGPLTASCVAIVGACENSALEYGRTLQILVQIFLQLTIVE